jgi:Phage capsid family
MQQIPRLGDYTKLLRQKRDAVTYTNIAASLAAAHVQKNLSSRDPAEMFRRHFAFDKNTQQVFKAATSPATTSSANLSATAFFPDSLGLFGSASASGKIFDRCLNLKFDAATGIVVPNITASGNAAFVGEGAAMPVIQFDTSNTSLLTVKKLGSISVFTHELFDHSMPNVAAIVGQVMARDIGLATDAVLLGTTATTVTQPGGIRWGIPALGASSATLHSEAMVDDIAQLVAAVSLIAGNSDIILIASPAQAAALKIWRADFAFDVFASSALPPGTVLALAVDAFVVIMGIPRFEIVSDAALVMDTVGADITTASVQGSVKSLIQSDLVAVKTVMELNFGLRVKGGAAWITGTAW